MSRGEAVAKWLGSLGNQVAVGVATALVLSVILASRAFFGGGGRPASGEVSRGANAPTTATSGTSDASGDNHDPVTTTGSPATTATTSTPATTAPAALRLGDTVQPASTEPCHSPGSASGSAWLEAPVRAGGQPRSGYYCNLFSGGTGGIDFLLGKSFATLRLRLALADDSDPARVVKFEMISDGSTYLAQPTTIRLGDAPEVVLDVHGTTRLQLRVTEVGNGGGGGGAAKPVWADSSLTRVP